MPNSKELPNNAFGAQPMWQIVLLCCTTFGLYIIYRLYLLSGRLNLQGGKKTSDAFIYSAMVAYSVSFISLVMWVANGGHTESITTFIVIHLVSMFFDLSWIMKVRAQMINHYQLKKGDALWLHPLLCSFLHVIYIQYKLNRGLAEK